MVDPPIHLSKQNYHIFFQGQFDPNDSVAEEEIIFRRIPTENYKSNEYLTGIQSDIFNSEKGFSVNRAKFCFCPEDVLWVGKNNSIDKIECDFTYLNTYSIISIKVKDLKLVCDEFPINLFCKYAPEDCNVSHANIFSNPSLKKSFTPSIRRQFWAKLASYFAPPYR